MLEFSSFSAAAKPEQIKPDQIKSGIFEGALIKLALLFILSVSAQASWGMSRPSASYTPGRLCTASDPDFSNLDYPENIARCNRNISTDEKKAVAQAYGNIPQSQWANYEFDHLIPLCAGGANSITNLWPQPISEAHLKDKIEDEVCIGMKLGKITQAQAVQKIFDWFNSLQ